MSASITAPGAHPRMRGEHAASRALSSAHMGSSPHARGAPRSRASARHRSGLIPACAGSTSRPTPTWPGRRAHPRMRGEHAASRALSSAHMGSSPHARGAPGSCGPRSWTLRLIPACAGSTAPAASKARTRPAHPRMRGEHEALWRAWEQLRGSSPHARGARDDPPTYSPPRRLIPACAGSTSWTSSNRPPTTAHPRMRGEHTGPSSLSRIHLGSSPHARGARPGWPSGTPQGRLIPACAGSTG